MIWNKEGKENISVQKLFLYINVAILKKKKKKNDGFSLNKKKIKIV